MQAGVYGAGFGGLPGHLQIRNEVDILSGDTQLAPDALTVPADGGRGDIPHRGDLFGAGGRTVLRQV